MANAVNIEIRDRSKTAICRETLALCGKYDVTVVDMAADGVLVFHDRVVLPKVWPYYPNTAWAAPSLDENQWYGYCELDDGEGELTLNFTKLVTKLRKMYPLGSVVPVQFSVYKTGEGLIGTGEVSVLVTEEYEVTTQSFISFKGDKGDKGDAATVAAGTTTTLEPGNNAEVTNSGTTYAAVFDFKIPKGAKGETGDAAGFDTPTATATQLTEHAAPTAGVTASGSATNKKFAFSFGIPAGIMPKPAVGTVTEVGPSGTMTVQIRSGTQGTEYPILDFALRRGMSAYEVAVDNGYTGTVTEWLNHLIGGDYAWIQKQLAIIASHEATVNIALVQHQKKLDYFDDIETTTNDYGEKTLRIRFYE